MDLAHGFRVPGLYERPEHTRSKSAFSEVVAGVFKPARFQFILLENNLIGNISSQTVYIQSGKYL